MTRYLAEYGLFSCLLSVMLWLPGVVLAAVTLRNWEPRSLRPLASICLGLAVWTASTFVLAALGWLTLRSILVLFAIWVVLGFATCLRLWNQPGAAPAGPVVTARSVLLGAFLALVLAPCLIAAMRPEVAWDAGTYHLTLPKLYIAHAGFRPVEFNVYSNWPLNTELLFAVAMLLKDHVLATLLHFGFGVLTLYAIFACCRTTHSSVGPWLAMFLLLTNHSVLWEMTVAYVDLAYAFFFLAGFVFLLHALEDRPGRRGALLLAGLCGGILAGIKLSGIVGAAAIGTLLIPRLFTVGRRHLPSEWRTIVAWFVLPLIVLPLPWLIKAAWYTGNPVYPLLYGWFGGPDWSPALSAQLADWQRSIGMGRTPIDYLLLPLRVIWMGDTGYAHFDGRICKWWIMLVPLAIVFGRRQPLVRRSLAVAGLYFAIWSITSQQMRFLIPILPLLAIAAAITVEDLLKRVRRPRRQRVLTGLAVIAAGLTAAGVNLGNCADAAAFLRQLHEYGDAVRQAAVPAAHRFINDHLPQDARLLCLNTNEGFFLERDYLADSFFEASQVADWLRSAADKSQVRRRLSARRITHILIANKDWQIAYPPSLTELIADPRWARPLYRSSDGMFAVLELASPAADRF